MISTKRKRVVLSISDKMTIINRLTNGESGKKLAKEFNIGASTISEIKNNSQSIINFASVMEDERGSSTRKMMRKPQNDKVDDALYKWFLQQRSQGEPISGPILCEKALVFNEELNGDPYFKASQGWLRNFKARHGIRDLEIHIEKVPTITDFGSIPNLKEKIDQQFDDDFIYNVGETGLFWKTLPKRTISSQKNINATDLQGTEERITILICVNASGTHKLPLLLISKSKKPKAFKNIQNLPVDYMCQRNGWMNTEIFIKWYDNNFIPQVKKYQEEIGKRGKVLLLLDNSPSHPSPESLIRDNGMFSTVYLPSNLANLVQPVEQGIFECIKLLYRKELLLKHLMYKDSYQEIDLKECTYMIAKAWNDVKELTIKRSWNIIKGIKEIESNSHLLESEKLDILNITSLNIESNYETEDINLWLNCDKDDYCYEILDEEEIMESIQTGDVEENDEEVDDSKVVTVPSHNDVFKGLNLVLTWMEHQDECEPNQLLQIRRNFGATRVTSARVDRRILRQAVAAPQATCTAILQHVQDTLDHSISTRTISRRLVANGLHSCRPLRRLPLTPPNRRQRLEWCRARSTWMTEWHRVVFSDESRFCLSSDSRRVRVWRRRGERSNPAAIVERPTVRQRGIMVWGAIAYDSRSPLLRIQGTMTAQRYVDDVLRPVTLPYLQGVPNALYQQDNARPHTARISQQPLQDVQMLPWPPYSPGLSPIEHVWDIIGRRLHALPQPRSEDELWQMVEREWRAIPQDAIRTLIDSLPRRVAACIAVRGGPTCY
ncbi:hypothetical protein LAZ67_17002495 [Cordylochernes scorpioides]|uniref:Transposase n=1 Tax=Cordylochernes scorpioides TaxID=51811 RepID=A0ABY6LE12_9ARAC|nr:hypothetical protein LAZ67_17002495 [Cordylochernes scorpioides]